jgi:hypothetical protein
VTQLLGRTVQVYHDRIVALAGIEDKVVTEHNEWKADKGRQPVVLLSSHLKV